MSELKLEQRFRLKRSKIVLKKVIIPPEMNMKVCSFWLITPLMISRCLCDIVYDIKMRLEIFRQTTGCGN